MSEGADDATSLPAQLGTRVNGDPWLVHRGRFVDTRFLLEVGATPYLVTIHAGRIESVVQGPFVMPQWRFALRAGEATWTEFWRARPRPGFNDVMAMIKLRTMKLEGDPHPFVANLLYFKDVLASLRPQAGEGAR